MRQFISLCLLFIFQQVGLAQEFQLKAFKSEQSPVIDGRLNDSAWNIANPFAGFRMVEPTPGTEPTEKTEVRIIYDNDNQYICANVSNLKPFIFCLS
jgi:hypothetical protein